MMADDSQEKETNVEGAIKAVTGLAKAVPIYQDAAQPAAKEIGKALETVAKTVNVALAPVSALVWGYDHIKEFVDIKVSEKLQNVPNENIITPPVHVAGPALESLRYTGSINELKELYANLIASSMDSSTIQEAHPCFVEIIKQLSADEAKLLTNFTISYGAPIITIRNDLEDGTGGVDAYRNFSLLGEKTGCQFLELVPNYLDNLCRLGLTEIPEQYRLIEDGIYDPLETHETVTALSKTIDETKGKKSNIIRKAILVTDLGQQFIKTCVQDHRLHTK